MNLDNLDQITFEDLLELETVPGPVFLQLMANLNPFPYPTRFSCDPFIEIFTSNVFGACNHARVEMEPKVKKMREMINSGWLETEGEELKERMSSVLALFMPSMLFSNEPAFIGAPFLKTSMYATGRLEELFLGGEWELVIDKDKLASKFRVGDNILQAGGLILNAFYDQSLNLCSNQVISLQNKSTGLRRYYQMSYNFDHVRVMNTKPLIPLTEEDINQLLRHLDNPDTWLEKLPPENFSFKGFGMGRLNNVTRLEVLSIIKDDIILGSENVNTEEWLVLLQRQLKDYLQLDDIELGIVDIIFREYYDNQSYSLAGTNSLKKLQARSKDGHGIYFDAIKAQSPVVVEDLGTLSNPSHGEMRLAEKGYKSVILFPSFDKQGNLTTILEIVSKTPLAFNNFIIQELKPVFDLLLEGNKRYLRELNNRTNLFIQDQFTSLHPSVEWKFTEVSRSYEIRKTLPNFDGILEPIVFKDVYPLYGQADIVGSSELRNKAIKKDLESNLKKAEKLMQSWAEHINFSMLDALIVKVQKQIMKLRKQFISSDESAIVELLTAEIHPFLKTLKERYTHLPHDPYMSYVKHLDPDLNIVYNERKKYEISVSKLSQAISDFIEEQDDELQETLPHYFEKYKTDGVEYNIYLGQSILKDLTFNSYYLKEFKLWQLIKMCEVTRMVDNMGSELPIPLETAQLIFTFNNPLSIRFRMDEKQFDVDGTYNVRYEILKKRIDKSLIKGTKERVTRPGMVSIIYLQDEDRKEYLEYLDYLKSKDYVDGKIEDLELEKLQGAEGLRALRFKVMPSMHNQVEKIDLGLLTEDSAG